MPKKTKADAIAVSTHSKEGMDHFLLGSFAETLIHHSTIPVIAVNPRTKPHASCKNILFPTDLSAESRKAFLKMIPLAKSWEAKVTVFFKAPNPGGTIFETGFFCPRSKLDTCSKFCFGSRGESLKRTCCMGRHRKKTRS